MAMPKNGVRKGPRKVDLVSPQAVPSDKVSDADLVNARVFLEPLAPLPTPADANENDDLAKALAAYQKRNRSDLNDLTSFLTKYPQSRWKPSLQANIARVRFENGYFTEAIELWKSVWEATKDQKSPGLKAVADESVTQLMLLIGRLGQTKNLESYLSQVDKRPMFGTIESRVQQAKEGLTAQKERPKKSFKCGPFAINTILNIGKPTQPRNKFVDSCESTANGTNLATVMKLSKDVGLNYQLAKRDSGAPLIVPSVVHFKLAHFGAITEVKNGRYHLQDQTFDEKGNFWLTADALNTELDGYSLIPAGPLPHGWQPLSEAEAANIWGKGNIPAVAVGKGPADPICFPCIWNTLTFGIYPIHYNPTPPGMAEANIFSMNSTLQIKDCPVAYTPPVGPQIPFVLNYNHQEGAQPGTYTFSNFGQDWTLYWISYLTLDGSNNATVRPRGGGYQVFDYTIPDNIQNPYPVDVMTQANLTVISAGSVYQRQLPDGTIEVFNQPDGTGRIFMTQVIDPQGNSAYMQYDTNFRLVAVTDAIGQVSKITYLSNTFGNAGFYKISQISDPFLRSANFTYDSTQNYLLTSTDTIGITSQFQYDTSSSFINLLTTPYGSTSFNTYSYNDGFGDTVVVMKIVYPDNSTVVNRLAYGESAYGSNFWDREAMALYPNDFKQFAPAYATKSTLFNCSVSYILQPVPGQESYALLAPINYTYPGAGTTPGGEFTTVGSTNKPSIVTQGSETSTFSYNALSKVTRSVDPVGRTFTYRYDANNIDLLEARQTRGTNNDLLGKWIYNNNQHVPNKYIDGSGQVTLYSYNSFGEPTTITDPNGNTTTNFYNANGQLMQTDGPLPGNSDVTTYTYDGYNRPYSVTDAQGYTIFVSYDNADRPTLVSYPDGTTEQTIYNRLDAVLQKDRIGRWTQTAYDPRRQPVSVTDPLGRKTQYAWCNCGSIAQITDPNGNITSFQHNLAGQLVTKTVSDNSNCQYSYDSYGNVSSRTDNLSQVTNYAYNRVRPVVPVVETSC
jgi:YD repeat-containing protein